MKAFLINIIILIALLSSNLECRWSIMRSDADSLVRLGADYIYNIKFDSASKCFDDVIKMYPEHPAGYFLKSMISWWRITLWGNVPRYEEEFLGDIKKVLDVSGKLLNENEYDLTGLFFRGAALGYRGRFYAQKQNWLDAASDGTEAYTIMQKCHETAPGNHDIMLGTGLYNYFAEALTEKYPVLIPIMALFPRGDKRMGILQLKASAYRARYAAVEAEVTLMQLYYNFEKNMIEAEFWANKLSQRYPDNPYFQRYIGRIAVRQGDWAKIERVWRQILLRALDRNDGFNNLVAREGCYYVGLALDRKGDYEMSRKYLRKCIEISKFINEDNGSYAISSKLKIALIEDKTGNRSKAVSLYNELLKLDDYDNSHEKAKKYLKTPYK